MKLTQFNKENRLNDISAEIEELLKNYQKKKEKDFVNDASDAFVC